MLEHLTQIYLKQHYNMIRDILEGLQYDFKGEYIDVAKGKYKIPETMKEGYKQLKNELWQKK